MLTSKLFINCITVITFLVLFYLGTQLSLKKVLWTDELYTHAYNVEPLSYEKIIKGEVKEGCNSPLFYLTQKIFLSVVGYHFPFKWLSVDRIIYHPQSQVFLRILPNICMSLGLTLIVRFFLVYYSWQAALLSLITSLSSYMVLVYWAEARPYALWFLLSVLQLLLFLRITSSQKTKNWPYLAFVHCLLSLTTFLSIAQVLIVSVLLYVQEGGKGIKKNALLLLLPIMIYGYYSWAASLNGGVYHYKLVNPLEKLFEAFSMDRFLLLFVLGLIYFGCMWFLKYKTTDSNLFGINFLFYSMLLLLFSFALFITLKFQEISWKNDGSGFVFSSRYLLFLTPLEIMTTVLGVIFVFRFLKKNVSKAWVGQFICMISFFYLIHAIIIFKNIYSYSFFAYH